jgi:CBS domain-containing protein
MGQEIKPALSRPSGLYLESTPAERFGVLPGEDRLVRDVMSRNVVCTAPVHSLRQAAELMRTRQVPALVVMEDKRPAGIVTERDLVVRGLTQSASPDTVTVKEVLQDREPISCRDNAILAEAARLMADHRLQSIPVVNGEEAVVGILSLLDVAGAVMPDVAAVWLTRIRNESGKPDPATAR